MMRLQAAACYTAQQRRGSGASRLCCRWWQAVQAKEEAYSTLRVAAICTRPAGVTRERRRGARTITRCRRVAITRGGVARTQRGVVRRRYAQRVAVATSAYVVARMRYVVMFVVADDAAGKRRARGSGAASVVVTAQFKPRLDQLTGSLQSASCQVCALLSHLMNPLCPGTAWASAL